MAYPDYFGDQMNGLVKQVNTSANSQNPSINTRGTGEVRTTSQMSTQPQGNTGWFGNGGYLSTGSQILGAATSAANAYLGYKNYGLAQDQFAFTKNAANRDIANEGKLINNDMVNANNVGLALAGNTLTPEQQAASRAAVENRKVNTAPIG